MAGLGRDEVEGWGEVGLLAVAGVVEDFGHEGDAVVVEEVELGDVLDVGGEGDSAVAGGFEAGEVD